MIHGFFLYIVSVPIKYHDSRLNSTPAARKYFAACGRRKFPPYRENSAEDMRWNLSMAPSPGNGTGAFPHFAQFGLSACFQVLIQPPEFIENSGKNIRRQRHPFEKLLRLQNCCNSAREKIMFLLQAVRISEVELWCAKGDLNPHALRHRNLNPGRLPFRHSRVRRLTIARIAAFRNREGRIFPYIFRLPSGKSRGTVYC